MLPFKPRFRPGEPVYGEVVYAVKKAIVSGVLRPGDAFPSVRALSQELKINPNTAHRIVTALVGEDLLEVLPGMGTVVASARPASRGQLRALLDDDVERLVVEARRLSLDITDIQQAVRDHWTRLS